MPKPDTATVPPEPTEEHVAQSIDLLKRAIALRATDIHVGPTSDDFEVRFRIDGYMEHYCYLSTDVAHGLLNQWKVNASLSIADPFHSQEGRLELPASLADYEARITTAMIHGGEMMAIRLLSRQQLVRSLAELGLEGTPRSRVEQLLRHGEGIVLITGPTGVGKTTTMYSIVHALDDGRRNIVSIEDPVEFDIPSIRQMEVDEKHGITMSSGLKTLLRLDPDIVMVGEIRDVETATAAMRAASSGKYVFTTFHTRDIASTVTGLRDLHVDSRSLAGNIRGMISQRLVRRICDQCKVSVPTTTEQQAVFQAHGLESPAELLQSQGCDACRGTGFANRIGVFEVEANNTELAEAIEEGVPEDRIRELLQTQGQATLAQDALSKVARGITTLDEIEHMSWVELNAPNNHHGRQQIVGTP